MAAKKGQKAPEGAGRPKGSLNKMTMEAKAAIEEAFQRIGDVDALAVWAQQNQSDFYKHIWIKILPLSIAATVEHRYALRLPQPALKAEEWAKQNQATIN